MGRSNLSRLEEINDLLAARECEHLISQETAELAIVAGQIGVWDWHPEADRLHWNGCMYRLFGYGNERPSATLSTFLDRVIRADHVRVTKAINDTMKTGDPYFIEYMTVDGTLIWARGELVAPVGLPPRMIGTCIAAEGPDRG